MKPNELTLRGLLLGVLLTFVFTAANVYLGLKVGLTFASSIPAAVISMAILSAVRDSTILENNIVQTVASAAGTLSAIIFVLPGLVIVGWWTGFPFWQSFLICLSGGVLGVLFTIPLRRALVTDSTLPYPEGVAAAEVLKVGSSARGEGAADANEAREGLTAVVLGAVASGGLAIAAAMRVGGQRLQRGVVPGALWCGAPGGAGCGHGHAGRAAHRMGHCSTRAHVHAADARCGLARLPHDDDLELAGALHWCGGHWRVGDLHARDARTARDQRSCERASFVAGGGER